jgi:hypothetical protein
MLVAGIGYSQRLPCVGHCANAAVETRWISEPRVDRGALPEVSAVAQIQKMQGLCRGLEFRPRRAAPRSGRTCHLEVTGKGPRKFARRRDCTN